MGAHFYCRPCDTWYRAAHGWHCPECGAKLEARTFRYPEDVFGPPLRGEAPIARRDLKPGPRGDRGSRGIGVLFLIAGHVGLFVIAQNSYQYGIPFFFIGITQLIYAIPMMVVFGATGKSATVSGVALGAGITFLLNAACFGVVCGGAAL